MTASGGTPAYMAPEVLLKQRDDGRSDIFSLGLTFYEMLGGEQSFQTASLATTIARIVHVEPPPLKNVPGPLARVISRAWPRIPTRATPTPPRSSMTCAAFNKVQNRNAHYRPPAISVVTACSRR